MMFSFFRKKTVDIDSDVQTIISALCVSSRNELLSALRRDVPPSALAIMFAIATSRVRKWLRENSVVFEDDELLKKSEEVWLIEGLAGFYSRLEGDELLSGRLFFRTTLQNVYSGMDDITAAKMNPLEALQHIKTILGSTAGPYDDERVGPHLLKCSLKVWISAPEACRAVFQK